MSFADRAAVKCHHSLAGIVWFRFGSEVVFDVLPIVPALVVGSKSAARIVTAVNHAVLAAGVAGDAIHDSIFGPVNFLQHLLVTTIMAVSHQIAWRFPAFNVAGGDGPGSASQLAFAGEEFLVNGSAENSEALAPFLDFRKFLAGHLTREEEVFGLLVQTLDHVLLGGIVLIAG